MWAWRRHQFSRNYIQETVSQTEAHGHRKVCTTIHAHGKDRRSNEAMIAVNPGAALFAEAP